MFCAVLFLIAVFWTSLAQAHEARPGYLELNETARGQYDVLWKQPANGEYALRMDPIFPADCALTGADNRKLLPGAMLTRFHLACPDGLDGRPIAIAGLEMTLTDVLVRLHKLDGREETHLARPTDTTITIGGGGGGWVRAWTYLKLGLEHIATGVDHLLFVLGLLLIVRDRWMLLKTISAFTLAHSMTLAAATLGFARLPGPPVEAAIALSILFLGVEVVRFNRGEDSLTACKPWLVAFAFGLLHGFGFATGLTDMGLPRAEIPEALLLFNVGVEIGQLTFVAIVLGLERALRLKEVSWARPAAALPAFVVGIAGAFWTWQRVAVFFGTGG
ncbi:MAG TPA: HupE/UreJ family protein [Alphaproteobacteria bacterium]|nr:HupE/UreJ family protein [Alphaproteobacteria bacterium]